MNGGDRAPLQAVEKWKILRVTKASQSFSSAGEIVGGLFQSRRWGALQKVGTRPSRRQGAKEVLDSSQAGGIPKDPLQSLLCCPPFRAWACLSAWGQQDPSLRPQLGTLHRKRMGWPQSCHLKRAPDPQSCLMIQGTCPRLSKRGWSTQALHRCRPGHRGSRGAGWKRDLRSNGSGIRHLLPAGSAMLPVVLSPTTTRRHRCSRSWLYR